MKSAGIIISVVCVCICCISCDSYDKKLRAMPDRRDSGLIYISCDESFKPIIEQMVLVYESHRPETKINVHYKPEADCFNDLEYDSIRMIITTRRADAYEQQLIVDSFKASPESRLLAYDAIAVIVHPDNPDSLLTMEEIKQVLTGKFRKNLIPVFDGVKATSTVRFIVDSVLKNDSLTKQAVAARSSQGVVDYIARTKDAIGFIGVSWIGNREDSLQLSFLDKVKVVHIESTDKPGKYILPSQVNIFMKRYPMMRELIYTLKEKHQGLGNGFADFMNEQIGQLIFHRAYLMPAWVNYFKNREVQITEE